MHQNEWFQVWFFKNFLGRGSPSPLPRPLPRFFSGFALVSGFALNSRALRALDSGFALDTRALRALDSGFALNFRLRTLVWPPPKIKSWIRPCSTLQIHPSRESDVDNPSSLNSRQTQHQTTSTDTTRLCPPASIIFLTQSNSIQTAVPSDPWNTLSWAQYNYHAGPFLFFVWYTIQCSYKLSIASLQNPLLISHLDPIRFKPNSWPEPFIESICNGQL